MSTGRRPRTGALRPEIESDFTRLIEARYGLRQSTHAARNFAAAIEAALTESGLSSATDLYGALLAGRHDAALDTLVGRLTVGETHFYRVGPQVVALRDVVLPDLLHRRAAARCLRVWSAGCSTGEEPYTIAILIRELLSGRPAWDVQILATDVSRPALAQARAGVYRDWSFRGTPVDVRERYFSPKDGVWQLSESIRTMVSFEYLNLAAESFSRAIARRLPLDLIVCRNVTIYLSAAVVERLYARFRELLAPDGWLLLGPADPPPTAGAGLEPVSLEGAVLWRPAVRATVASQSPPSPPLRSGAGPARPVPSRLPPPAPRPRAGGRPVRRVASGAGAAASPPSADADTPSPSHVADLSQVRDLLRRGEREAARAAAERLAAAQPLNLDVHLLVGMLYLEDGAVAEATVALRRATFLDANHPVAQFGFGRALLQQGDRSRARAAFLHARRALAPLPAGEMVWELESITVGPLRQAIEAQLARLGAGGDR